jgi:hypothetical protein
MNRLRRHVLTSWIACLAILFGALAPTLSHAVDRAAPQVIVFPICSAAGHTMADIGLADAGLGTDPLRHCPFCVDQHHAPGLLPQTPAALAAVGGAVLPLLFYQAPEPLFHWAATRSRAPPRIS